MNDKVSNMIIFTYDNDDKIDPNKSLSFAFEADTTYVSFVLDYVFGVEVQGLDYYPAIMSNYVRFNTKVKLKADHFHPNHFQNNRKYVLHIKGYVHDRKDNPEDKIPEIKIKIWSGNNQIFEAIINDIEYPDGERTVTVSGNIYFRAVVGA